MNNLSQSTNKLSRDIALYLVEIVSKHGKFPARSFYGESFCLNLLYRHNLNNEKSEDILLSEYLKKDKNDKEFHFEFNNYAFVDLYSFSDKYDFWKIIYPLKFKYTPVTNWTLLRANTNFMANLNLQHSWKEVNSKINNYQLKSGLILDDVGVKSFQYHCFSAAMLIEIYEKTLKAHTLDAFLDAVSFIRYFILENGEALYIGRGQEQSFGLGVLVYVLAKYYEHTKDNSVLKDIQNVVKFLESFQLDNKSFPLVFNGLEKSNPFELDMMSESYLGWYPYNNFFDYLPFMGYFLKKASDVLAKFENMEVVTTKRESYYDSNFIVERKEKYTAICSVPGGYWSNDLSFPLIQYRQDWITPMLGGEQFQKSLYKLNSLSMPFTKALNLSWRKYGVGKFYTNKLFFISIFGIQIRSYIFKESSIEIKYRSLSWLPSYNLLSLLEKNSSNESVCAGNGFKIQSFPCSLVDSGYSVSGKLKIYKFKMNMTIKMELE